MGDDRWSDEDAQRTHLMEVPRWLVEERRRPGPHTGQRCDQSGPAEAPVESEATMALQMGPVPEMRRPGFNKSGEPDDVKEPVERADGDEVTQLLDASELRLQKTQSAPSRPRRHVEIGPGPTSADPPLLDASQAVSFPFERLERMASEECRALRELYAILPPRTQMSGVAEVVQQRLEEVVGCAHEVRWCGAGLAIASGRAVVLDEGIWTWGRMPPGHNRFVVGAQRSLADAWIRAVASKRPGILGRDFEFGMVTYLLAEFCDAFAQKVGWPAWSWAVNPVGEQDLKAMLLSGQSIVLEVAFTVECKERRGAVRWWLPSGMLRQLKGVGEEIVGWREAAPTAWWGGLPIERPVVVGTTSMEAREWEGLRAGDIMVVKRHGVDVGEVSDSAVDAGAYWRFGASQAVRGRLVASPGGDWHFEVDGTQLMTTKEEIAMSEERREEERDDGVAVERTQMDVEVRLGTIEMELATLARLRPGQVLDCETPLGSSVELVVGGTAVGNGELVGVDGRLGVRILSMNSRR